MPSQVLPSPLQSAQSLGRHHSAKYGSSASRVPFPDPDKVHSSPWLSWSCQPCGTHPKGLGFTRLRVAGTIRPQGREKASLLVFKVRSRILPKRMRFPGRESRRFAPRFRFKIWCAVQDVNLCPLRCERRNSRFSTPIWIQMRGHVRSCRAI